jgi:hypothetical protein
MEPLPFLTKITMGIQQKQTCRITNWREYNKSLVSRGDITIWFSDEALEQWAHANDQVKVGRPFVYSDTRLLNVC